MPLIGVDLIREVVQSIVLTGRIKNVDPVSLLIVAQPERCKTSIVLERPCESLIALTDCTGKGLMEVLKQNAKASHIVLTDMTAVFAHKPTVNAYTVSVLNAMTEEGVRATAFPGEIQVFSNGKRGLIGCLTPDIVVDGRSKWVRNGFTTRMLPFSYEHSVNLTVKIMDAIEKGEASNKTLPQAFVIPKLPIDVKIPASEARELRKYAIELAKTINTFGHEVKEKGYRRHKQIRALAQGHALLRSWKGAVVNSADLDFLKRIRPYISYTECKILP